MRKIMSGMKKEENLKWALVDINKHDLRVIRAVENLNFTDETALHEICLKFGIDVEYGTQDNGFSNIKFSV